MPGSLTLRQVLEAAGARLRHASDSPQVDRDAIVCHVLQVPRSRLYSHGEDSIPLAKAACIDRLLERRCGGEPLAYVIGAQEFWSRELLVSPDVLIPRPETELLVELALAEDAAAGSHVLDLGTGSGAIAIAIKAERPDWLVVASDRSPAALRCARRNARRHRVEIEFLEGSWFEPLGSRRFRSIVANPPYVAHRDPQDLTSGYEPSSALHADQQGLADLAAIVRGAPGHLLPEGCLLLEHGHDQRAAVQALLESAGFVEIASFRDLAGRERALRARHPGA